MRDAGLIAIIAAMVIIAAMFMISNTIDSIENNHPEAVVAAADQDDRVLVEVLYDKYDNYHYHLFSEMQQMNEAALD